MNPKQLVRLSNIIGTVSIVLLIYWVFSLIAIEVFGLRVFRKNLSDSFFMSILGILALMLGALITNIMFNLTRIAEKHNLDERTTRSNFKAIGVLLAGLPLVVLFLFIGDYLTTRKKEKMLVNSARSILETNTRKSNFLVDYHFSREWINKTEEILEILSKTDENFPHVAILVKDSIDREPVFLSFTASYSRPIRDTLPPLKKEFIQKTTQAERDYLNTVFEHQNREYRYHTENGRYELFYPYHKGNKHLVIYFSQYQRYGKIGR